MHCQLAQDRLSHAVHSIHNISEEKKLYNTVGTKAKTIDSGNKEKELDTAIIWLTGKSWKPLVGNQKKLMYFAAKYLQWLSFFLAQMLQFTRPKQPDGS